MCEGIARLGNGICLMAVGAESIVAKTSKLLRASRTYALKNISIDWGTNFTASTDVTMQTDVFRQAPEQITQIIASNRLVVFALTKHSDFVVPENIVVKGQLDGKGEVLSFDVPVTRLSQTTDEKNHTHLIHTLAARRIIRELDDEDKSKDDVKTREMMIHLGEQYQLASRYTSFVAVEKRVAEEKMQAENVMAAPTNTTNNANDSASDFVVINDEDLPSAPTLKSHFTGYSATGGTPRPRVQVAYQQAQMYIAPNLAQPYSLNPANNMPGSSIAACVLPPPPAPGMMKRGRKQQIRTSGSGKAARKMMASRVQPDNIAGGSQEPDPQPSRKRFRVHNPSARLDGAISHLGVTPNFTLPGVSPEVVALVRLQSFDGSFPVTLPLERILGKEALTGGNKLALDQVIWATVLAIVYLQKHLDQQPELLESLVEKARDYVLQTPGVDLDEALNVAKILVE
jgi:hypothetical protein